VQVGFSPEGSAQALVLNIIGHAHQSIQMIGYSFQAPDITQALVAAHNRGVEVRLVVEKRRNQGKTSQTAINFAATHGIQMRIIIFSTIRRLLSMARRWKPARLTMLPQLKQKIAKT